MPEKLLYLGYMAGDFDTGKLRETSASGVMADYGRLNERRMTQIHELDWDFGVAFGALPGTICPASTKAKQRLLGTLAEIIRLKPDIIWFDHLRFEGRWEVKGEQIGGLHEECEFCKGRDRTEVIAGLARDAKVLAGQIKLGYFAVPYQRDEHPEVETGLGQDHEKLGNIFDYVSPMVYHRMIGKPIGYIGGYTRYLAGLGVGARIIPIVQVKDMPDNLPDNLSMNEINEEVRQATTSPSGGVAIFCWDHAVEKGKSDDIAKILQKI